MEGMAEWSSAAWREEATAWVDARLDDAGERRSGPPQEPRVRPWSAVMAVPTPTGRVWFKACGAATAFEAGLYELLARLVPRDVLEPLAVDAGRGWVLLPDGGRTVGEALEGEARWSALGAALVRYGELQRTLAGRVDELLALGLADMRPAVMPQRFGEAVAAVAALGGDPGTLRRVAAAEGTVRDWCERLAAAPGGASLDHNDLHPWNVLEDGRFYDWGDAVVAHPYAVALVPLDMLRGALDPAGFRRARDAYLEVFGDLAPRAELVEALELARRVATVARALTWERATRAATEQGAPIDPAWASAAEETLASVLDEPA